MINAKTPQVLLLIKLLKKHKQTETKTIKKCKKFKNLFPTNVEKIEMFFEDKFEFKYQRHKPQNLAKPLFQSIICY